MILTPYEFAEKMNVKTSTVYYLIRMGKIESFRIGDCLRCIIT